jgi:hypothetical protein
VVSDENERNGDHEMRATAKGTRVRNAPGASNAENDQAGTLPAFLALAPASRRVLEPSEGRTDSRNFTSVVSSEVGGSQSQKSAPLSLPEVRRAQDI